MIPGGFARGMGGVGVWFFYSGAQGGAFVYLRGGAGEYITKQYMKGGYTVHLSEILGRVIAVGGSACSQPV